MKSLLEYYKTEIGDKLQKARKSVDLEGKGKKKRSSKKTQDRAVGRSSKCARKNLASRSQKNLRIIN